MWLYVYIYIKFYLYVFGYFWLFVWERFFSCNLIQFIQFLIIFFLVDNFVLKFILIDIIVFDWMGYFKIMLVDFIGFDNEVFIILVELWG